MSDINELRNAVNFVKLAVPNKPLIPQLGYMLLTPEYIAASDGECYLKSDISAVGIEFESGEDQYAVDIKSFDLIKKAANEADARVEDGKLKIDQGRSTLDIPLHPHEQANHVHSVKDTGDTLLSTPLSSDNISTIQKSTRGCRVPKNKAFANLIAIDFDHRVVFTTDGSIAVMSHIDGEEIEEFEYLHPLPWRMPSLLKAAGDHITLEFNRDQYRFYSENRYGIIKKPKTGADPADLANRLMSHETEMSEIPEGFQSFIDQAAAAEKEGTQLEVELEGHDLHLTMSGLSGSMSATFELDHRYINFHNSTSAKRVKEAVNGMDHMGISLVDNVNRCALVFMNNDASQYKFVA